MSSRCVLVVDDEQKIRSLVASYLRDDGFEVIEAADGNAAVEATELHRPDLVVMDIRMPGMDGIEALAKIRKSSDVYVILLTARAEESDRIIGLSVGADDYVIKPFSPRELVARVKAVLRRSRGQVTETPDLLEFEGITVDVGRREVRRDGLTIQLTALQFNLLAALAESPGRVFTRRQLIERVWGWDFFGEERIVDAHIRNLRSALGDDSSNPQVVGTVRGVGYRFLAVPR